MPGSLHSSVNNFNDISSLNSEKLGKSPRVNNFLLPSLFLEISILCLLAVFAYYLRFTDTFSVFNRVFDKNDESLNYPAPNATEVLIYVNDVTFYTVSALVPPAIILVGELFYQFCGPPPTKTIVTLTDTLKVPLFARRLFRNVGGFWTGGLITSILTDSIKLLSGRHRPNFFSWLDPSIDKVVPYMDTTWSILDTRMSSNARFALLSFPSYYASIAGYAAAFAICYVYVLGNIHGNYFVRPVVSGALFGMAALAGYTRWMLYLNFWEDILLGYIIGIAFAVYMSFGILNGFEEHEELDMERIRQRNEQLQEARPGFFRFLPRLTMRPRRRPYPPLYLRNTNTEPGPFRPDPVFQQDLHHTIENFDPQDIEQQ